MLEVLLRVPNGNLRRLRCEITTADAANLILRGFQGEVQYYKSLETGDQDKFWEHYSINPNNSSENKSAEQYQQMVASAVSAIQNHTVQKVVLSRQLFWDCPSANPKLTFEKLLENYPTCTVFALKHQEFGSWMGASPEVLLESTEAGYRSMSLAGTRLEGNTLWGQKELEEQKFVTKEVHKSLKVFGGKITREAQSTFNAGPVEHLLTWVNTDNLELDPKAAAEQLHPTPAICGSPSNRAQELIAELEGYDRALYAGYLGLFEEQVHATVLLRTMQWFSNGVQFYAGGGITKDSVPLDEWMETQHKISALKELIQFDDLR